MSEHQPYMKRCLELGQQSMDLGNSPVGAVLVKDGKIIGEGLELAKTHNDITYHAEVEAIRDALKNTGAKKLEGTVLYTTHEPCLLCSYAIRHYRIAAVYFGLSTGDIGGHSSDFKLLATDKVSSWQEAPLVQGGIMKKDCEALQQAFLKKNQ